jgi:methylphosphotriester-DNA--protein-cysteine methyltransferase
MLGETTSRRGLVNPDAARRHFRLTRYAPAPDLAPLVERHWIVEWDLHEPFTQEIVTHPSVNLVFEARFALVHVTPKWVLRRVRLHEAAERMADGGGDWAALALDLGYFDQAHFSNDFKAVVGRSPAEYAALCAGLAEAA